MTCDAIDARLFGSNLTVVRALNDWSFLPPEDEGHCGVPGR